MTYLYPIQLNHYLVLGAILFCIGIYGIITCRNLIKVLMSIELMLNAANINFVAFSNYVTPAELTGQVFAIFIITIAAAEAGVALAIVLSVYKHFQSVDIDKLKLLKW